MVGWLVAEGGISREPRGEREGDISCRDRGRQEARGTKIKMQSETKLRGFLRGTKLSLQRDWGEGGGREANGWGQMN